MNKDRKPVTTYKYKYYSKPRLNAKGQKTDKPSSKPNDDSKKISFSLIVGSLIFMLLVFLFTNHAKAHSIEDFTKATIADITSRKPDQHHVSESYAAMSSAVNRVINDNSDVSFEVSAENLNNGSQINFGQSGPMVAGSVSKVMTATDYLSQVEQGNVGLGDVLEDGNPASYDLQQMIVVSDDTSWESLNDDLSYAQLQTYANNLGLNSYNWEENTLSAQDTTKLFAELYQGKLLNQSDTQLLLGYMKQANYRNLILPVVPSSDTVYHKVGEYNDSINDAAIITNAKQTIVLSIYTTGNGSYDLTDTATMIQDIAKPILEYYNLE